jgi:hypothetical protein
MMADLSLLPLPLNILVTRGTTRRIRLTLLDAVGTPIDLTGDIVRLTVKETHDSADTIVYQVDTTHVTPASGITDLIIPKSVVIGDSGMKTTYQFEIRLIESGGNEFVWWYGLFVVHPVIGII